MQSNCCRSAPFNILSDNSALISGILKFMRLCQFTDIAWKYLFYYRYMLLGISASGFSTGIINTEIFLLISTSVKLNSGAKKLDWSCSEDPDILASEMKKRFKSSWGSRQSLEKKFEKLLEELIGDVKLRAAATQGIWKLGQREKRTRMKSCKRRLVWMTAVGRQRPPGIRLKHNSWRRSEGPRPLPTRIPPVVHFKVGCDPHML